MPGALAWVLIGCLPKPERSDPAFHRASRVSCGREPVAALSASMAYMLTTDKGARADSREDKVSDSAEAHNLTSDTVYPQSNGF